MGTRVRPPSMLCLIYFSALLSLGLAQSIGFGKCPKVTVQENFDVNQYTGRWYEIQSVTTPKSRQNVEFVSLQYNLLETTGFWILTTKHILWYTPVAMWDWQMLSLCGF